MAEIAPIIVALTGLGYFLLQITRRRPDIEPNQVTLQALSDCLQEKRALEIKLAARDA